MENEANANVEQDLGNSEFTKRINFTATHTVPLRTTGLPEYRGRVYTSYIQVKTEIKTSIFQAILRR
jgi:hypothetical protein